MDNLLKLEMCKPAAGNPTLKVLCEVITLLQWEQWDQYLRGYSDQQFYLFLVRGIREGLRVGFNYSQSYWAASGICTLLRICHKLYRSVLQESPREESWFCSTQLNTLRFIPSNFVHTE